MDNQNPSIPLEELAKKFAAVYKTLPRIGGNEIVNFSLDNFRRQGFLGDRFEPWRPRKANKWSKKKDNPGRSILVLTAKLRRATRIIRADGDLVVVGNYMPYARAHNEGVKGLEVQHVKTFTRTVTTIAKVSSIKTHRTSSRRVAAGTQQVKAHNRTIRRNTPARPFLKASPYLTRIINRVFTATVMKAIK